MAIFMVELTTTIEIEAECADEAIDRVFSETSIDDMYAYVTELEVV